MRYQSLTAQEAFTHQTKGGVKCFLLPPINTPRRAYAQSGKYQQAKLETGEVVTVNTSKLREVVH